MRRCDLICQATVCSNKFSRSWVLVDLRRGFQKIKEGAQEQATGVAEAVAGKVSGAAGQAEEAVAGMAGKAKEAVVGPDEPGAQGRESMAWHGRLICLLQQGRCGGAEAEPLLLCDAVNARAEWEATRDPGKKELEQSSRKQQVGR